MISFGFTFLIFQQFCWKYRNPTWMIWIHEAISLHC
jgi:hypothetical protein